MTLVDGILLRFAACPFFDLGGITMAEDARATPIPPRGRNTEAIRKTNKANVRRILEAFNTGNTAIVDEVAHPALVSYTPKPGCPGDREGLKKQIVLFRQMFPDARFEEQEIIAEGDVVHLRWKMVGTAKGEFLGRRLPEKQITQYGQDTVRLAKGKQVEHRDTFDLMGFLDKLGVLDPAMLQQLRDSGFRR
jgi:predicted ester cyclase